MLCVTLDNDPTGSLSSASQDNAQGAASGEQADVRMIYKSTINNKKGERFAPFQIDLLFK